MPSPRVAVVGAGQSAFGALDRSAPDLFREAVAEAAASVDRNFGLARVKEAFIGTHAFGGAQLGNSAALLADRAGLRGIPAHRVENACASSGFAFRAAYLAVASGEVDVALAGGVERMTDLAPWRQRSWLGTSGDTEWERLSGLTFAGVYALMAERHMHEFGTPREALAAVAEKNHAFGVHNPKAQFRKAVTREKAMGGPIVADPFTVFDCCGVTDGASAAILASAEAARSFTDEPLWVLGSGAATDRLALHERPSLTRIDATARAAADAFRCAGITPRDVDVAEVHDCFTIAEILALEDLGFCGKGEGGRFTLDGRSGLDGDVAVNTGGGLKAKGHPLGATGTGQIVELWKQLRGRAPQETQRRDAEIGLAHNVGGSGASCAVHVLGRR